MVSALFHSIPLLSSPKTRMLLTGFVIGVKKKNERGVSSDRLCPACRRSISLLFCLRIRLPDGTIP